MKIFTSLLHFLRKNAHWILLLAIIGIAIGFRIYALDANPVALNQDEAVNGYDAYSIFHTGRDHHGNFLPVMLESFEDWTSPLITYITVPFVGFTGLSEFSVRLPVAILGVFTIPLLYIFLRQIFHKRNLALTGAFLLAIMPWHIALSRWAIPPSIVPFFLIATLCLFMWAIQSTSRGIWKVAQFVLAGFSAGLLTYSYPTQKLFVPLLLALFCLIYFRKQIRHYFSVGIPYLLTVAPMYILTLSNPAKYNGRFSAVSIFSANHNPVIEFLLRYASYFTPYFNFGPGDADVMHHVPGIGSSYDFLTLFFYLGILICLFVLWQNKPLYFLSRRNSSFLLAWVLISPIPASLTIDYFHVLRVIHGLPLVIVFSLIGLQYSYDLIRNHNRKIFVGIVFVLISLATAAGFAYTYFNSYPAQSREGFQYGIKDYSDFLSKNEALFDHIYIDSKINNPYIYYLFYSKYDPAKLNYSEINQTVNSNGGWDGVKKIGKYEFKDFTGVNFDSAVPFYQVSTGKNYWYTLVYMNNDCYVVRDY